MATQVWLVCFATAAQAVVFGLVFRATDGLRLGKISWPAYALWLCAAFATAGLGLVAFRRAVVIAKRSVHRARADLSRASPTGDDAQPQR